MSRSHKGKSIEQKAFETLNRQVHQFDDTSRSGYTSKKSAGTGGKLKPPRFAVTLKLKNGKIISGNCVCFDNPKLPNSRLFFPTRQQKTNNSVKELCIQSHVDIRSQGAENALVKDLNQFIKDVHEQALAEFPEWLEKWGCRAKETNPLLNLDEIWEEWKFKKSQFGVYRLAAQAGFFTDSRPFDAERLEVVAVEIIKLP